jgi:hypothetical protein
MKSLLFYKPAIQFTLLAHLPFNLDPDDLEDNPEDDPAFSFSAPPTTQSSMSTENGDRSAKYRLARAYRLAQAHSTIINTAVRDNYL